MEKQIVIGKFGAAHGVKGWVKLHSFTQPLDNIFQYQPWHFVQNDIPRTLTPIDCKTHPDFFVVKFDGIDDPETARTLTHLTITIGRDQLPALPVDEYYYADLEGLDVYTAEQTYLGKIDHLFSAGAGDVIAVRGEEKQHLVPYLSQYILSVDLTTRRMQVNWDPEF